MRKVLLTTGLLLFFISGCEKSAKPIPLVISERGYQPSLTIDTKGVIRIAYGKGDSILFAVSEDGGNTFSKEMVIDTLHDLHLGMSRGPQISSSENQTVIVAMNKPGDIYAYTLDHTSNTWKKKTKVNDVPQTAKEGLVSIESDRVDNFYVTWLDLREDNQNKIYLSHSAQGANWKKNVLVYRSSDSSVCECCRPSLAVKGNTVQVMFRNWLKGSRDMYVASSDDQAVHFKAPVKLGEGTWKLNGCPMDGGAIWIDSIGQSITTWRREGDVYLSKLDQPERKLGEGRQSDLTGIGNEYLITWSNKGDILVYTSALPKPSILGKGTYPSVVSVKNSGYLVAWETEGKIVSLTVPAN